MSNPLRYERSVPPGELFFDEHANGVVIYLPRARMGQVIVLAACAVLFLVGVIAAVVTGGVPVQCRAIAGLFTVFFAVLTALMFAVQLRRRTLDVSRKGLRCASSLGGTFRSEWNVLWMDVTSVVPHPLRRVIEIRLSTNTPVRWLDCRGTTPEQTQAIADRLDVSRR